MPFFPSRIFGDLKLLAALGLLGWIILVPQCAAQNTFGDQVVLAESLNEPSCVFAADIDADGHVDLLAASADNGRTVWFPNDGTGQLGEEIVVGYTTYGTYDVTAADLDADGDLDVIIASSGDRVSWFENDGAGHFSAEITIATTMDWAVSVACADMDGDGDVDVVSGSKYDNKVAWYSNDGSANFSSEHVVTTNATYLNEIALCDLDGDGDTDILSTSWESGGNVVWYANDGQGNFAEEVELASEAGNNVTMLTCDLDGDLDVDVLYAHVGNKDVLWLENLGEAVFSEEVVIIAQEQYPGQLAALDLDGDGALDLATGVGSLNEIHAYFNDGEQGFAEMAVVTGQPSNPSDLLGADFNGNGQQELVYASNYDDKLVLHEHLGSGVFDEGVQIDLGVVHARSAIAVDLDQDLDLDVVCSSGHNNHLWWLENTGDGTFGTQQWISNSLRAFQLMEADVDNDGDPDVIAAGNQLAVLFNSGTADFTTLELGPENWTWDSVDAKDLNGDGLVDIVGAMGNAIYWFPNVGGTTFDEPVLVTDNVINTLYILCADLDGDQDWDVVSASGGDHRVYWYPNNGAGEFPEQIQISSSSLLNVHSMAAADYDGDGLTDLAVAHVNYSNDHVGWYRNNGEEGWSGLIPIAYASRPFTVDAGDVDGDGDPDVVCAFGFSDTHQVLYSENLGLGSFASAEVISTDVAYPSEVNMADFNADGYLDLVTASRDDNKVALFVNQTGFGCTQPGATNYDPSALQDNGECCFPSASCPTDLNCDGVLSVEDMMAVLGDFGCVGTGCVMDVDGDGTVGIGDMLAVLVGFGTLCD